MFSKAGGIFSEQPSDLRYLGIRKSFCWNERARIPYKEQIKCETYSILTYGFPAYEFLFRKISSLSYGSRIPICDEFLSCWWVQVLDCMKDHKNPWTRIIKDFQKVIGEEKMYLRPVQFKLLYWVDFQV